ncbi:monocarboxylate transporter 10-like [Engraulis encrasicolus]|uniref:monocarboxylate transporter 10-like n=1 Tax=Engraulis encrasicolus TaxID=184585 RepID=UPI002FD69B19
MRIFGSATFIPFRRFYSEGEEPLTSRSTPEIRPPPDGGWGWVIVFSSFLYNVLVLGYHNSFGVYLISLLDTFGETSQKTAWVGSISYGIIMICGPLSGKLTVRYGAREISIIGSIIIMISIICSSFAPTLNVMFLTHGILTGIGSSFAFTPGMIMISQYFTSNRALATGIVMSGGAAGALVQTRLHQYLIDTLGWRRSLRVFSTLMILLIMAGFTYLPLNPRGYKRSVADNFKTSPLRKFILDLALWKDRVFLIWVLANGLCKFGFFIPYVHLVRHAVQLGIPVHKATNIMLVLGLSSMVSRIIFGRICDSERINRLYFNMGSVFSVGILYLLIPVLRSYAALLGFGLLLGIADAGNYILLPVLTFDLMGAERMPVAWGFMLTVNAISCFGPPFTGWMNDTTGSYDLGFIVAGTLNVAACVVLAFIPCAQRARQTRKSIINVSIGQNNEIMEWNDDIVGDRDPNYLSRTQFRCPELNELGPTLSGDDIELNITSS